MPDEPAYLKALRDYTSQNPSPEEREAVAREFYLENDRAAGLLNAGWVDLSIERAIGSTFKEGFRRKVFGSSGPLRDFSARIEVAFAIGLFGPQTHHDLSIIRTLRNQFAHCMRPITFQTPEVVDVCSFLNLPDRPQAREPLLFEDFGPEWRDKSRAKTRYIIACNTIISHLLGVFHTPRDKDKPNLSDLP